MNATVYNVCIAAGTVLVSVGVAMVHVPSGLIVAGALVIALTLVSARITSGRS